MKFLADECCDADMVVSLREDGHDILYITESKPGILDEEVLKKAFDESRILLTEDKGFGELVFHLRKPTRGIVLLRFDVQQTNLKLLRLRQLIQTHSQKLKVSFVIVDAEKFRFRILKTA
jgi:predicted nuclease of predicted toxin-antitoxin system